MMEDLTIDADALDVEWLEQPSLYMQYAKKLAQAKADIEHAKQALDVCKAELDEKIRHNPDKYNLPKVTETVISNKILMQAEYLGCNDSYIEAKRIHDELVGMIHAIDHRKTALENLVKLESREWFAGPKQPRDLSREHASRLARKEATDKLKASMGGGRHKGRRTK